MHFEYTQSSILPILNPKSVPISVKTQLWFFFIKLLFNNPKGRLIKKTNSPSARRHDLSKAHMLGDGVHVQIPIHAWILTGVIPYKWPKLFWVMSAVVLSWSECCLLLCSTTFPLRPRLPCLGLTLHTEDGALPHQLAPWKCHQSIPERQSGGVKSSNTCQVGSQYEPSQQAIKGKRNPAYCKEN